MFINPVSFGKVVLVQAPFKDACRIAEIANRKPKTKLDKQVKRVINDISKGEAYVFSFNPTEDKSYIFSGKEGREFWQSHCEAWDIMDRAHEFYGNDHLTDIETADAWENHAANVNRIINSRANRPIIGVEYNKHGYISAINVIR